MLARMRLTKMKPILLVLSILLAGCGRGDFIADCRTVNGLESVSADWSCEDVQAGEDAVITALGKIYGEQTVRDALASGVWMRSTECILQTWGGYSWEMHPGKWVMGTYAPWNNGITLCKAPIQKTSMAHEIAHAIENFTGYVQVVRDAHYMWGERGIYDAVVEWRTVMITRAGDL